MNRRAPHLLGLLLLAASALGGCVFSSDGDDSGSDLRVSIGATDRIVSLTDGVLLDVEGENRGESRVVWGRGSSSCQFTAFVRVGLKLHAAPGERACTDDLAEQGLDAGQSRREDWLWDGTVLGKNGWERLPPGKYKVYGAAGKHLSRNSVTVRVSGP